MTNSSQDGTGGGGGKLRLVIPKLVMKKEEPQPTVVKDIPNALVTGLSSVKLDIASPHANKVSTESIPLSVVLLKATQRSFRQLENIDELAGRMTDAERKTGLLEYVLESRMVFAKLLALLEWRDRFPAVFAVDECIDDVNDGKAMRLTELADRMCVKHYELARRDCPLYDASAALKRVACGYLESGLPTIFADYLEEEKELNEAEMREYISRLNRLIATRLSSLTLPEDCVFKGIEKGVVKLSILNQQLLLELSLVPNENLEPKWFLINMTPTAASASEKIKGTLGLMMQTKYNRRPFEKDTILTVYQDLQLYMSLFFLHQLYCQLNKLKTAVSMKIEHGEGHLKVLFYPNAECERLLLTVTLKGSQIVTNCSWSETFTMEPTFDCFKAGNELIDLIHRHQCKVQFARLDMTEHLQNVDYCTERFSYNGFTCTVRINKQTGLYDVSLNGTKVSLSSGKEVMKLLKSEASKHYISTLRHTSLFTALSSIEKTRIGSFPKTFIKLDDSTCLCVGMDELVLKRYLVFVQSDERYPYLFNIVHWERIEDGSDWSDIDLVTLGRFKLSCQLKHAGIIFDFDRTSGEATCKNLPLHIGIDSVVFVSDRMAKLRVDQSLYRTTEIVIQSADFSGCLASVKTMLALLLIISQHPQQKIVGTWCPLNLMIGNDTLTMDDKQTILLNGQPWRHRLLEMASSGSSLDVSVNKL